jgi:beta-glucuronidase
VRIPELHLAATAATDATGVAVLKLASKDLVRWSPQVPKVYDVEISAATNILEDKIGFRTIEVQGDNILWFGPGVERSRR